MANHDAKPDPLIGAVLDGKFRLVSLIGRGGMGRIYQAEQLSLGRMVALKLLNIADKTSSLEEFRERFYREASLCARLQHPNIVTIHDYGMIEGDGRLYIAMELLQGKTLMQQVKASHHLSAPEAVAIAIEIARGIREAHKHGIVHRDLKCSNVMLVADEDGGTRVKILDFGLVKSLASDHEELTMASGGFLGSPGYMSPEQIQRGMPIDHRADIYSLGVVLFRCLTGRNPFEGDQAQVLLAHVNAPPPALREANPEIDVPVALEALVRRMLEKHAEHRVAGAGEVLRALREISAAHGWAQPASVSSEPITGISRPQALDPTPTTGGTIQPIALSQIRRPRSDFRNAALVGLGVLASLSALLLLTRNAPKKVSPPAPVASARLRARHSALPPAEVAAPPAEVAAPPAEVAAPPPEVAAPPVLAPKRANKRAPKPKPVLAPPPVAPPVVETGLLSLDTMPWANVSENGHLIGQTPLIKIEMSEGPHTLTLTTESGAAKTFIVKIKAGQTTSKRLGLE